MGKLDKYSHNSHAIIRIVLSLVFLWFGTNQLLHTETWVSFLPEWVFSLSMNPSSIIVMNGVLETILGLLLLFGVFTRLVSLILGLHLLSIAFTVGYNDVGVRDFGLGLITLAISLHGQDSLSLDRKIKNSNLKNNILFRLGYIIDSKDDQ
tara:strand:- start:5748 stop:6200 length:453 start_codon:yes stop_codon:yes gene_type:complete